MRRIIRLDLADDLNISSSDNLNKELIHLKDRLVVALQNLSNAFEHACICDSNTQAQESIFIIPIQFDLIAGIGSVSHFYPNAQLSSHAAFPIFDQLEQFKQSTQDWLFGHLAYDLKNQLEDLSSSHFDGVEFPEMLFFQPRYVFQLNGTMLQVQYLEAHDTELEMQQILEQLKRAIAQPAYVTAPPPPTTTPTTITKPTASPSRPNQSSPILARMSQENYVKKIQAIKEHLMMGDCYELNYCMEYFAESLEVDPALIFQNLNKISRAPFSAYYKVEDKYVCCASPERFLKKEGRILYSQPIKGTIKRGATPQEDVDLAQTLANDLKERTENTMVVDLVRNDLAHSAVPDSLKEAELFQVYRFKQVHQLISTICVELKDSISSCTAIANAFPMGSMTGVPKLNVMKITEALEVSKRGLYAGSIGFFTPGGDFDFNVVIRSIQYNQSKRYISYMVGSAITMSSDPDKEYQECQLKAAAMLKVLTNGN